MSPHIIPIILFRHDYCDYCGLLQLLWIIADYCDYSDYCDYCVETQALSSQTSFKCVAGCMAYDIALPRYADGLLCNTPDDKFPRSEKDIVPWLLGSEQGVLTLL